MATSRSQVAASGTPPSSVDPALVVTPNRRPTNSTHPTPGQHNRSAPDSEHTPSRLVPIHGQTSMRKSAFWRRRYSTHNPSAPPATPDTTKTPAPNTTTVSPRSSNSVCRFPNPINNRFPRKHGSEPPTQPPAANRGFHPHSHGNHPNATKTHPENHQLQPQIRLTHR